MTKAYKKITKSIIKRKIENIKIKLLKICIYNSIYKILK